jgi:2-C-methyl-D-erythritol 4-phosphate cytidylyltransferase
MQDHKPHPAVALVLAGGMGSRMGRPKQFIELLGAPALLYTLLAFERTQEVARIYTVGDGSRIKMLAKEAGISKYAGCALPGDSRSLSTRSGLSLLEREGPETVVLVHDGSRCLVTPDLVRRVVTTATKDPDADGVVPALPVSDTIKVATNGTVLDTLDRAKLHAAQTPQAFRLGLLRKVYAISEEHLRIATDDASLVEKAGGRVSVVVGEKTNIKLTSPEDLVLAEAILATRKGAHYGVRS